jgi:hypothetical protein
VNGGDWIVTDYRGKGQFFIAFNCPAEHEAEGDGFFARHAQWMERTHPKAGDLALLQYTVSKSSDDDGNVLFLLAETYQTTAGIDNHRKLAHDDAPLLADLYSFRDKCQTIGWGDAEVLHSLW